MHNPFTILSEPSMMHAAMVHLPIALSVFGVPVLIAALFFQKIRTLRILALAIYATALVTSLLAEQTGEGARAILSNTLSTTIWELLDEHEQLGGLIKYTSGLAAIALLLSMIELKTWRECMLLIATCGAIATSVLAAGAAHLGGMLVYEHGVGMPASHQGARALVLDAAPPEEIELVAVLPIDPVAAAQVSYTRDIAPLINTYCIDCHEDDDPDGGYDMSTHAGMLKAGEKAGPGVIPGDPDGSPLVKYIRGELQPRMPKKEAALSVEELHMIRSWIQAGAKDDSAAAIESAMEAIEAAPAETMVEEEPVVEVDPFGAVAAEPAPAEMTEEQTGTAPETAQDAPVEIVDPFGSAATENLPDVMEEAPALKVDPFGEAATEQPVEVAPEAVPEAQPDAAAPVVPVEETGEQPEEAPFDPFG